MRRTAGERKRGRDEDVLFGEGDGKKRVSRLSGFAGTLQGSNEPQQGATGSNGTHTLYAGQPLTVSRKSRMAERRERNPLDFLGGSTSETILLLASM